MKDSERTLILLERLARIINNDAALSDIKPAQWEALRYFSQANKFSCTPSALTAYMGVTKGTISQTINALERKGLIQKNRDTGDKRSVSIALTARAQALLDSDPLLRLDQALSKLNTIELKTFNGSLELILKTALEQRSGQAFGVCKTCKYFEISRQANHSHRCAFLDVPLTHEDSELICREYA